MASWRTSNSCPGTHLLPGVFHPVREWVPGEEVEVGDDGVAFPFELLGEADGDPAAGRDEMGGVLRNALKKLPRGEREAVELQLDEQKSKHLATFKEGDFFGEVAMVDQHPRSATVRAGDEGVTVLRIPYHKLETLMDRNHHIGYVILRHVSEALCERIRSTNVQVRDTFTWGRF